MEDGSAVLAPYTEHMAMRDAEFLTRHGIFQRDTSDGGYVVYMMNRYEFPYLTNVVLTSIVLTMYHIQLSECAEEHNRLAAVAVLRTILSNISSKLEAALATGQVLTISDMKDLLVDRGAATADLGEVAPQPFSDEEMQILHDAVRD